MAPPSQPFNYASAAAGGNADTNSGAGRRDGTTNDWTRNRVNGTQTFRRTSTQSRDNLQQAPSSSTSTSAYAPLPYHQKQQSAGMSNGIHHSTRYSRDQLLDIQKDLRSQGALDHNIDRIFVAPFDRHALPSLSASRADVKEIGPDACWNPDPVHDPVAYDEMDAETQQLFSSVNSTIKQNNPKEGAGNVQGGRKTSVSNPYGSAASGNMRPGARRRETSDSFANNGPMSPSENKFFQTDPATSTPPPALQRRRTDFKDDDHPDFKSDPNRSSTEYDAQSPFASLRRTGTGPPSAGLNPPSASPWSGGPQTSAFDSMGAFGSFGAAGLGGQDPSSAKRPGFGSARGGSRFKDIMKSASEDMSPSIKEKSSFGALEKLPEEDHDGIRSRPADSIRNRPNRSETNPYDEGLGGPRTGSAGIQHDEHGIESVGFSAYDTGKSFAAHLDARTPHHRLQQQHEPASPTTTNPYQSPPGQRMNEEDTGEDGLPGNPSLGQPFGARRDVFAGGMDSRGQSGFGSIRGPSSMSGLGGFGNWGAGPFGAGTPGRERVPVSAAFGSSVFSPVGDLQSPGSGGFGPNNFFGSSAGLGAGARHDKLAGLFPPAMQDQIRSDSRNEAFVGRAENFSRDPFDAQPRRQDSFRGAFDDGNVRPGDDTFRRPGSGPSHTPIELPEQPGSAGAEEESVDNSGIPTAQQRQMVMPDRMRWVYRDPVGNVQGPWSGLEMHDWFKAGFFTAELQVKKLEDGEYEPLAQLVRRIGNSREPFLVPQIGIPHGPEPAGAAPAPWSAAPAANPTTAGPAQPPFANSFPSFGTTLTAHQQNALEQRKQEEQFLMARQKEFLATHRMGFMGSGPGHMQNFSHNMHPLQHHPSAHSLHSQSSFGNIASPGGYQPSPPQRPIQPPHPGSGFPPPGPSGGMPQSARDDEAQGRFARMSGDERSIHQFGLGPQGNESMRPPFDGAIEAGRLMQEMDLADEQTHRNTFLGQQGRNDRLDEFQELRGSMDHEDILHGEESLPQPIGSQRNTEERTSATKPLPAPIGQSSKPRAAELEDEPLSLTQQVQRQAAANEVASRDTPIKPPPTSQSPLPAPTPQHGGRPVAETLAAESRSTVHTPVETPGASLAPWAERTAEMPKRSLKEIQEDEAKKAAEMEAHLSEQRRILAEQERLNAAATQVVAPAPGLPSTSTWASSASPATPTTPSANAWAKPVSAKSNSMKTLAQIQKEEEARKQRAAAAAAAAVPAASTSTTNYAASSAGNRYAQMASKNATTPTPQAGVGGAWTTVGSSGKPKTPAAGPTPPAVSRTVSSGNALGGPAARPTLSTTRSTSTAVSQKDKAKEELTKWTRAQFEKSLTPGLDPDDLVQSLLQMPAEIEILSDIIYQASQTLDGRRIAEEFLRRRKAADKGQVIEDSKPIAAAENGNKWNEVAKKNPAPVKEDTSTASFKVVSSKKKGKR